MSCIDYCSGGTNVDGAPIEAAAQTDDTTKRKMDCYEKLANEHDIDGVENSHENTPKTDADEKLGKAALSCVGIEDPTDRFSHSVQGELFPESCSIS